MKHLSLAFALLLLAPAALLAQTGSRWWPGKPEAPTGQRPSYVPIEMQGDIEAFLREQFKLEQELQPLKDLVEKFRSDGHIGFDPKLFQGLDPNDPNLQQLLQQWAGKSPLRELREPQLRQLQKVMQAKLAAGLTSPPPAPPSLPATPPVPREMPNLPPPDDALSRMQEEILRHTEDFDLDFLRDSPGFQHFLDDMRQSLRNSPDGAHWASKILPKDIPWHIGEKLMERFEHFQLPESWHVSLPTLGRLKAPRLPAGGGMPSLPQISPGGASLWLLLFLLCGLLAWRTWSMPARRPAAAPTFELGPWPVRPEAVATRTELIQAFDYLALLQLGLAARSWNHRTVAERWAEQAAARAEPARTLADLYELARYTAGPEALAPEQYEPARRALVALSEGRA